MRIQFIISTVLATLMALVFPTDASATTRVDALAMPLGSWPAHLECVMNEDGSLTGDREEEIVVTDAPDEANVLTRTFPDPTCQN